MGKINNLPFLNKTQNDRNMCIFSEKHSSCVRDILDIYISFTCDIPNYHIYISVTIRLLV